MDWVDHHPLILCCRSPHMHAPDPYTGILIVHCPPSWAVCASTAHENFPTASAVLVRGNRGCRINFV